MASDENAVVVRELYKSFKLPHEQHSGIKQLLVNFAKRKKGYETQHVLDDVSFEIKKGEFFGIVGRNGSGKSTLLKLLAGIYAPDKGLVQVNGSLTPFIELGVGFNPELTGRENVFMNGALLGFGRKEMELMYDDIVEFAELHRFMDQKLKNYSSGMQVRLAFSIAIRAKSEILLIDEVLAVGDSAFQQKCFDYFEKLKEDKRTIILVSHDMASIRRFCSSALLLDQGKIKTVGSVDEVTAQYALLNKPKTEAFKKDHDDFGIEKVNVIHANHQLNIRVRYKTPSTIRREPIVGVTIVNALGVYVTGFNNLYLSRSAKEGSAKDVVCTANTKDLLPNDYHVHVSLYSENFDLLDYKNHSGIFTIVGKINKSKDGSYDMPIEWSN